MESRSRVKARGVRVQTYAVFFFLFAAFLFFAHAPLLQLPYFWDEAGQFIPAALDILREGAWIPHTAMPVIHPPGVMAYLAGFWRMAGYTPAATRAAMLLLASFALLAAFLLAIELSKHARGVPAFLAAGLLCVSPLFFAQSMLAQLDAPAMLFTTLALLLFLQDRIVWSAAACVVLVLVKETGLIVPLVFAGWLMHERRWREAAWFLLPVAVLGGWIVLLAARTGHWLGDAEFARYNLWFPLHPARIAAALVRRLYYLFFANLHWLGAAAILYAWRKSPLFESRSWRVAWLLVAAHIVMLSLLGGAVLERYLLPVMPVIYAAMAASLTFFERRLQLTAAVAMLAGMAAANFINPPYPFPYEDNLAFTDFVKLHAEAADYIQRWHPASRVATAWPLTAELSRPDLGFVRHKIAVRTLTDFSIETLGMLDWENEQVIAVYSRTWTPELSFFDLDTFRDLSSRLYGYPRNATMEEARAALPLTVAAHFERRGQWVDIYVNPAARARQRRLP
jgi:4-amino-4-deoxy-L-arabinose transferase-like glycosyltransferase